MKLILFFTAIAVFVGLTYVGGFVIVKAVKQLFQQPRAQAVKLVNNAEVLTEHKEDCWKKFDTPTYIRKGSEKVIY